MPTNLPECSLLVFSVAVTVTLMLGAMVRVWPVLFPPNPDVIAVNGRLYVLAKGAN